MRRYCEIACLLPTADAIDVDNAAQMADIRMVRAELAKVQTEMDAIVQAVQP